jgi:Diadenosine tetraphosphate (Ap4A) hydrolase and other HIT family hydrolases
MKLVGKEIYKEFKTYPEKVIQFGEGNFLRGFVDWQIDKMNEEAAAFINDVRKVAKAIHKAFNPDKVNYGAFADTMKHLHLHIVPKYEGGSSWGKTFEMNPQEVYY